VSMSRGLTYSFPRHGDVNSRNSDARMPRTFGCSCTRAAGASDPRGRPPRVRRGVAPAAIRYSQSRAAKDAAR
jgi:hypothetical protein